MSAVYSISSVRTLDCPGLEGKSSYGGGMTFFVKMVLGVVVLISMGFGKDSLLAQSNLQAFAGQDLVRTGERIKTLEQCGWIVFRK